MKITKVDVFKVTDPASPGIYPILCRVYTDAGIYGDGEVAGIHGSGHAAFAMLQDFAKYLIGKDPMKTELLGNLTNVAAYDAIKAPEAGVVQKVIARMTPNERAELYDANTPSAARMMNEMVKAVGTRKMKELMLDYPAAN